MLSRQRDRVCFNRDGGRLDEVVLEFAGREFLKEVREMAQRGTIPTRLALAEHWKTTRDRVSRLLIDLGIKTEYSKIVSDARKTLKNDS